MKLFIIFLLTFIMSCSKKEPDKQSTEIKNDSVQRNTVKELPSTIKDEVFSQSDYLGRADILEYIRVNKLDDKYDYWLYLKLSRNVQYVELMKGAKVDQYLFKKYRSLKDTIPLISVQKVNIPFKDIITKNLINELNESIENIPSGE